MSSPAAFSCAPARWAVLAHGASSVPASGAAPTRGETLVSGGGTGQMTFPCQGRVTLGKYSSAFPGSSRQDGTCLSPEKK